MFIKPDRKVWCKPELLADLDMQSAKDLSVPEPDHRRCQNRIGSWKNSTKLRPFYRWDSPLLNWMYKYPQMIVSQLSPCLMLGWDSSNLNLVWLDRWREKVEQIEERWNAKVAPDQKCKVCRNA